MVKKYFLPVFLSITFVLLLLFLNTRNSLDFVEDQNNNPNLPAIVPTKAVETPWNTYRNEKYGFEFEYPNGLTPNEINDGIDFLDSDENSYVPQVIRITTTKLSYEDLIKEYDSPRYPKPTGNIVYDQLVSERTVKSENSDIKIFNILNEMSEQEFAFVEGQKQNYLFYFFFPNKIFDRIFSTFKFLPDVTTWKTYSNPKIGISFDYPNNFLVEDSTSGVTIWDNKIKPTRPPQDNWPGKFVNIDFQAVPQPFSISKWLGNREILSEFKLVDKNETKLLLGEYLVKNIGNNQYYLYISDGPGINHNYILVKNNSILTFSSPGGVDLFTDVLFKQLLSTLKFTK